MNTEYTLTPSQDGKSIAVEFHGCNSSISSTRAYRLARALPGKYRGHPWAYHMSRRAAKRFEELYAEGYDVRTAYKQPPEFYKMERDQAHIHDPYWTGKRIAIQVEPKRKGDKRHVYYFATYEDMHAKDSPLQVCGCCGAVIHVRGNEHELHRCLFGDEWWCADCKKQMKPGPYTRPTTHAPPARCTFCPDDSRELTDQIIQAIKTPPEGDRLELKTLFATFTIKTEDGKGRWKDGLRNPNWTHKRTNVTFFNRLCQFSTTLRTHDAKRVQAALQAERNLQCSPC